MTTNKNNQENITDKQTTQRESSNRQTPQAKEQLKDKDEDEDDIEDEEEDQDNEDQDNEEDDDTSFFKMGDGESQEDSGSQSS